MKKTITETGGENWWFWCPGCETHHYFSTKRGPGEPGPVWSVTGPEKSPTFAPSLLCRYGNEPGDKRCHLFLRNGMVQYLGDCTHSFKNKTIPVEDPCF